MSTFSFVTASLVFGRKILAYCLLLLTVAPAFATPNEYPVAFYVDNHGWHSGIIVPRVAIPRGAWPSGVVERDFAGCDFLELGWGDRTFYPAKHPGVLMALDAALLPGPSVLHIAGFRAPLAKAHAWSALVAVPCTREEMAVLCRDLGRSFETDTAGKTSRLGTGLYGIRSGFYPARGNYWVGNTCNTWTAREIRAGGLSARVNIFQASTSGQIIRQAQRLAGQRQFPAANATPLEPPRTTEPGGR